MDIAQFIEWKANSHTVGREAMLSTLNEYMYSPDGRKTIAQSFQFAAIASIEARRICLDEPTLKTNWSEMVEHGAMHVAILENFLGVIPEEEQADKVYNSLRALLKDTIEVNDKCRKMVKASAKLSPPSETFLEELRLRARHYGWTGDYMEIEGFVTALYKEAGHPPPDMRPIDRDEEES